MDEHENELSRLVDQLNRSAIAAKAGEKRSIDQLLAAAVQSHASDIILVAGSPATLRVNGALAAEEYAVKIDGMYMPPFFQRDLEQILCESDTRVVDQHMQTAEREFSLVDRARPVAFVRDVMGNGDRRTLAHFVDGYRSPARTSVLA